MGNYIADDLLILTTDRLHTTNSRTLHKPHQNWDFDALVIHITSSRCTFFPFEHLTVDSNLRKHKRA
jgi:hypothetical protein